MAKQRVESDVSTPEQALAHVAKTEGPSPRKTTILAKNDPKAEKGYENLGPATDPRAGKQRITTEPTVKEK